MKKIVLLLAAVSVAAAASAVTYDGIYVSGLQKNFFVTDPSQTNINVTGGLAFDPSSQNNGVYDRLYLSNRSADNTKRGIYGIDIVNETHTTRLAFAGDSSNDQDSPGAVAVDSSGNAYVGYGGVPAVWKAENPSGGSPVETQMLGNYGATGDDDPLGVVMVPAGFGGGYDTSDLVLYDNGYNANGNNAITIIDSTSTVASPVYTTIWTEEPAADSFRATASDVDGKVYISHWNLDLDDLGGTTNAYVIRLDNAGNTERVFLDIDPALVPKLDDAITVNQDDGSLWMTIETADTTRDIVRVDVANAVSTNGDFIASASIVIEDIGYNVGRSSIAISPDGTQLAIGAPDGQDSVYVYDIIPEPATLGMFAFLGIAMLWIRRKFAI